MIAKSPKNHHVCFVDKHKAFYKVCVGNFWQQSSLCIMKRNAQFASTMTLPQCGGRSKTGLYTVSYIIFGLHKWLSRSYQFSKLWSAISFDNFCLSLLLYAEDIALIALDETSLQRMLSDWCTTWKLSINVNKTKVMHFRPQSFARSEFIFQCSENTLRLLWII